MTLEELAVLAQHEFESIRRDMVTKAELEATEANILRAIESLGRQVSTYSSEWNDLFERLDDRFERLENRVERLERSGRGIDPRLRPSGRGP